MEVEFSNLTLNTVPAAAAAAVNSSLHNNGGSSSSLIMMNKQNSSGSVESEHYYDTKTSRHASEMSCESSPSSPKCVGQFSPPPLLPRIQQALPLKKEETREAPKFNHYNDNDDASDDTDDGGGGNDDVIIRDEKYECSSTYAFAIDEPKTVHHSETDVADEEQSQVQLPLHPPQLAEGIMCDDDEAKKSGVENHHDDVDDQETCQDAELETAWSFWIDKYVNSQLFTFLFTSFAF